MRHGSGRSSQETGIPSPFVGMLGGRQGKAGRSREESTQGGKWEAARPKAQEKKREKENNSVSQLCDIGG